MANKLKGEIVTITGGTGSFGATMAKHLLSEDVSEIRIFSRDENKQDNMRIRFRDERLRFFIGDVRDYESVNSAVKGSKYVFHAAALKQVPSCEFFPMQAIKTNVEGSDNVLRSAVLNEVESVVCLSTDKAVYPINAMGMSKAMMEKVAQSYARLGENSGTRICVTRYGNVMMSRGSVIPLFIQQLLENKPITITNPDMTRFLMSLDESVTLVKHAFLSGKSGDLFVKKAPACTIGVLAKAVTTLVKPNSESEIVRIGTRHGEKLFEVLVSSEEKASAIDEGDYYRVELDGRDLNYGLYFDEGESTKNNFESFNSHNTNILNVQQVIELLQELPEFAVYKEPK